MLGIGLSRVDRNRTARLWPILLLAVVSNAAQARQAPLCPRTRDVNFLCSYGVGIGSVTSNGITACTTFPGGGQ